MPRFYFDIRDGGRMVRDEDGLELADIDAAGLEASRALSEMARDAMHGLEPREFAIEVRDGADLAPLLKAELTFTVRKLR